jgi:hypothetical protein
MNFVSDEDRALEAGDAITCKKCGEVFWVDEGHSCNKVPAPKIPEWKDSYPNF